jgi:phage tail sheath gpL-like
MSVAFNQIPPSGLTYPIMSIEINAGLEGSTESRVLIINHKAASGALPVIQAQPVADVESIYDLVGPKSALYNNVRGFRRYAPTVSLSIMAVEEVGTKRTASFTVPAGVADGGVAALLVGGRRVFVQAAPGAAAADVAASLAAAINGWYDPINREYLAYTATAAAAVVTLTAVHAGVAQDHVIAPSREAGNLLAGVVVASVAGTGVPDFIPALAALGDDAYDWILFPASDAATMAAVRGFLSESGGRWSWSRQIYGHGIGSRRGTAADGLTYRAAYATDHHISMSHVNPDVMASHFDHTVGHFARMATWLTDTENGHAAVNMSDLPLVDDPGLLNGNAAWSYATNNALVNAGMSVSGVGAGKQPVTGKFVTLGNQLANGQPSTTFRDIQAIACVQMGFRKLRQVAQHRTKNRAAVDRNPYALATQITPDDVKAAFIVGLEECVRRGFFENVDRTIKALVVQRDIGNPARFNVGLNEVDLVNPADVFAISATVWAQTRA